MQTRNLINPLSIIRNFPRIIAIRCNLLKKLYRACSSLFFYVKLIIRMSETWRRTIAFLWIRRRKANFVTWNSSKIIFGMASSLTRARHFLGTENSDYNLCHDEKSAIQLWCALVEISAVKAWFFTSFNIPSSEKFKFAAQLFTIIIYYSK